MPRTRSLTTLLPIAAASARASDTDSLPGPEAASDDRSPAAPAVPTEGSEASSSSAEESWPANSARRCMFVDTPIGEAHGFYRSTLSDRGYEMTRFGEGDGIAHGNLSRTVIRAMKPGLQINVQPDEFDPSQTPIVDYRVQGKVQIDVMRR